MKLLAVDINAIEMSTDFVAPKSDEMKAALAKLHARAPLGSTDLPGALSAAAKSFAGANPRPEVVGEGALLYPADFPNTAGPIRPSAGWLARVVTDRRAELLDPEPLYLRRPDATMPGQPKRVTAERPS